MEKPDLSEPKMSSAMCWDSRTHDSDCVCLADSRVILRAQPSAEQANPPRLAVRALGDHAVQLRRTLYALVTAQNRVEAGLAGAEQDLAEAREAARQLLAVTLE